MASRASSHGSTTSSARRGAAEATDGDAATVMARRAGRRGGESKASTGCDKLGGATVQPDTAELQDPEVRAELN
jgi:hypothetical protein